MNKYLIFCLTTLFIATHIQSTNNNENKIKGYVFLGSEQQYLMVITNQNTKKPINNSFEFNKNQNEILSIQPLQNPGYNFILKEQLSNIQNLKDLDVSKKNISLKCMIEKAKSKNMPNLRLIFEKPIKDPLKPIGSRNYNPTKVSVLGVVMGISAFEDMIMISTSSRNNNYVPQHFIIKFDENGNLIAKEEKKILL